jgi:hypothetical protein
VEEKDGILKSVDAHRRSFLKQVLASGFAAPIIATFAIEALSTPAQAFTNPNSGNQAYLDEHLYKSFFFS